MTSAPAFANHNIALPNTETRTGDPLTASLQPVQAPLRLAQRICPVTDRPSVVDLGCNEGGFAVEFARAGYDVLGIDARQSHIDRCNYARVELGLDNLRFVCDDARNVRQHGTFDIVLCFGLLYHLDEPVAYLRQLGEVCSRLLLLNTHYALTLDDPPYGLSGVERHEGVPGRWYPEPDWRSREEMEASSLSSWQNTRSFWPLKPHLLQALRDVGFQVVLEQFDHFDDIAAESSAYAERHWRGLFAGIK